MTGPAAAQGWVKSTDPQTGRAFYANHVTRQTQWEPPEGWQDAEAAKPVVPQDETPLPSNWEVMHDPTTGKPFYVDHQRKITTWTRPTEEAVESKPASQSLRPAAPSRKVTPPSRRPVPQFSTDFAYTEHHPDSDLSDALPKLEFAVLHVDNSLRSACAHCQAVFSVTKRRHHCRLCGDVYCDACSSHRHVLPLESTGDKAVRTCNACHDSIEADNYFAWRRYLTPLELGTPEATSGVASLENVNAALYALYQDVTEALQSGESKSLPVTLLLPAVWKHVHHDMTVDRVLVALAAWLALESFGNSTALACALHGLLQEDDNPLLQILEGRTGGDRVTRLVHEQTARIWCSLTDPAVFAALKLYNTTVQIDMERLVRVLLDPVHTNAWPQLRWATATVTQLVQYDTRQATEALHDAAAVLMAGGEAVNTHTSILHKLLESGSWLLLSSQMHAADSHVKSNAVQAVLTGLQAARALDAAGASVRGFLEGPTELLTAAYIQHAVTGGVCGSSVATQVLSADTTAATRGCQLWHTLLVPSLLNQDEVPAEEKLAAVEAAVSLVSSAECVPALLGVVQSSRHTMDLRLQSMEVLAACTQVEEACRLLSEQHPEVKDCAWGFVQQESLGNANTPTRQLKQAASLIVGALSAGPVTNEFEEDQDIEQLIKTSVSMSTAPDTLRGDGAPQCLGVLATLSRLLHKQLKDDSNEEALVQCLDAGLIPHIYQVLKEYKNQAGVGAFQACEAVCKIVTALWTMALNDEHNELNLRRLYEAVDACGSRDAKGRILNLENSCLTIVRNTASKARKSMILGMESLDSATQTALTSCLDAALRASAALCGHIDQGRNATAKPARKDIYSHRRSALSALACDVLINAKPAPVLLPTMLVGGFGHESVASSLGLVLAVVQNEEKASHLKLTQSGILVPAADLLKSALSHGNLFQFSAALTLVRCCGPHISAGQGGGTESVREAIRIATNVLVLPLNPGASLEQLETQEKLKSECIETLEALSQNTALWSVISKDALPSIVKFLRMTAQVASQSNLQRQAATCAALRAVLKIIKSPSHAVAAAEAGIADPLGILLSAEHKDEDEIPMIALEVLHAIASNEQARQKAKFLENGLVRNIAAALGSAATDKPKKPTDTRADVTFLGLEIMLGVLFDAEGSLSTAQLLHSPQAVAYLDAVASETKFVRCLCASLLLKTEMTLPRHDVDSTGELAYKVPKLYGSPLILVPEMCAGQESTHAAAACLLMRMSVYACGIDSPRSQVFWNTVLLNNGKASNEESKRVAAVLCAHFLSQINNDYAAFVPADETRKEDYETLGRPLVRHRLLEAFRDTMNELAKKDGDEVQADPFITSVVVAFNLPHICLSLWKDPALLDLAFEVLKSIVEQDAEEVLHLFVESKPAISSMFDLLNVDVATIDTSQDVGEIKRFLASVLGQLAENCMLNDAVNKHDVRSSAIAAVAAACLGEEERPPDEDADVTSSQLSSVLMGCLVDLCTVKDSEGEGGKIQLSASEADAMAKNLGKKICHMVISRFLERARLQEYEMEIDEDIMDAPDVSMLCAVAEHKEALVTLRSIGGLHALSLVASQGDPSAIAALTTLCNDDPASLLEDETYSSFLKMLAADEECSSWKSEEAQMKLETSAYELLGRLCNGSTKGRVAVSKDSNCEACLLKAMALVSSSVNEGDTFVEDTEDDMEAEEGEEEEVVPTPTQTPSLSLREMEENEMNLTVAACCFLAGLASTKKGGHTLREDESFTRSLIFLSQASSVNVDLRYAAFEMLASMAPYTGTKGAVTIDALSDVILGVLMVDKIEATKTMNVNQILVSACGGLAVIFDLVAPDKQKELLKATARHFRAAVKACIVTRSANKEHERAFAAEATYHLTVVLLLGRGKQCVNDVYRMDVLTSMLHLTQWRYDPKTALGNTNPFYWDASVYNSLLLFSTLVWRPEEELISSKIDLKMLSNTSLMLARAGKAPRKALSVKAVLTKLADGTDASAAAVPAQRILDRIYG